MVGIFMAQHKAHINYDDLADTAGAFITMIMIVLTFSIANGIAAGFIVYTLAKVAQGKRKEVPVLMYVLSFLFVIYFLIT